jgi:hypothetical protein
MNKPSKPALLMGASQQDIERRGPTEPAFDEQDGYNRGHASDLRQSHIQFSDTALAA